MTTSPVSASAGGISTFTVGGGAHLGLGTWAGESAAQAGEGFLRTNSHTSIVITDHQASLGSGFRGGGSHASFTIDDVVISGPVGGTVSGVLNLLFEGSLAASASFANAIGGSGSYGEVSISVGMPGFGGNGSARLGAGAPPANTLTLTNSGLLTGYGGGLVALQINSALLPVNTPFSITLDLQSGTLASYNVDGTGAAIVPVSAEGFSNYNHAFSFATSGPVFTLPAGYTANSASGMIVDNHMGPDTDGDGAVDWNDNCTLVANPTQVDSDQDGYGNHCDGDLNNSGGNVNAFDTPLFRAQQGQPSVAPTYNAADINASGGVNAFDTPLFRALIGFPPGPSGLACAGTIPCP